MGDIASEIVSGLSEFAKRLESGEPVDAVQVERFNTPDGPMHIRKEVVIECLRRDNPADDTESSDTSRNS